MGFLDLTPLTTATGLPADVLGPAIVLLSSYILAFPFSLLGTSSSRGLFSIAVSGLLFTALFNVQGLVQIALLSSVCYGLSFAWPTSKHIPVVVIVLSLSVLAANHLKSQFFSDVDAPRFDQTIPMMVAVQKMATFAWSVHDGTRPNRELSKTQQSLKLTHIPSLLDYLGFIFFYPAFILGPSFHYKTYSDFISGTGAFTLQPTQKLLPGRWKYLAETIITGAVCSLLNIIFAPRVPYEFGLTDAFLEYTWIQRASYFFVAALVQQMQFFGAWKLAEGACVLCGFGYVGPVEGKVGVHKWNRCENVRIWELEFPENPRMFMSAWNVQTALWLRSAIYLRLAPEPLPDQTPAEITKSKSMAGLATHVTFLVSAFWHGFYPGYYTFFLTLSFLITSNRLTRKLFRPHFHNPNSVVHVLLPVYHVVGWFATVVSINYATIGMQLRTLEAGLTVWRRLYFYVHIGVVLLFALDSLQSMLGGGKKRKPRGEVVVEDKRVVSDDDAEEKRVKVE